METRHTPGPCEKGNEALLLNIDRARPWASTVFEVGEPRNDAGLVAMVFGASPEKADALAGFFAAAPDLRAAAVDALAGWRYIRAVHGDLPGVGWDRVESALSDALARSDQPA